MEMDKKEFEKMLRKNSFHGVFSLFIWLSCMAIASDFLGGVAKGLEINELWKLVVIIPAGIWFFKFMEDK